MNTWEERPTEVANLLNPAFCGQLLRCAVQEHQRVSSRPLPYPLAFLVLPIVLHKATRERIRSNIRQPMHAWLQDNQEVRIGFAERAKELVPITNESLAFLLQLGVLSLDDQAGMRVRIRRNADGQAEGEVPDCYLKSTLVGRWFARSGSATIYTMWGVKP